ncbi:MAG: hypothetical protein DRI89_01690 [Bacteroidetes bacterium]|nr:MAG: hypothetical protein DRI89_01690 [Bacteroidota bacterium]
MPKKKRCHFCNEEFEYKRITAKYCSPACRQNALRRKENPDLYGRNYPIHIDLEYEEYRFLKKKASNISLSPEEFIKKEILKDNIERSFLLTLTLEQYRSIGLTSNQVADTMNIPQEQVLVRWLLDCADKEKKVIEIK